MTTSNTSESTPIILMPTEHSGGINDGTGVTVKRTTESYNRENTNIGFSSTLSAVTDELKTLFTFHPKEWLNAFRPNPKFPLFTLGDIDGFVALFMNNLATLFAVIVGLQHFFSNNIIYGKIIPGVSLSMLWGNLYYVYMARKLAYRENRGDVCTMPYGINTPGACKFVLIKSNFELFAFFVLFSCIYFQYNLTNIF